MQRGYVSLLKEKINHNRIVLVQGPKRVGKRQLIQDALSDFAVHSVDCTQKSVRKQLEEISIEKLSEALQGKAVLVIEEAQLLPQLQAIIELVLFEELPFHLVLTCSFEPLLDDALKEALEMQELVVTVYPLTFQEIANHIGVVEFDKQLASRLIYGSYPEVLEATENQAEILKEIVEESLQSQLNPSERINKVDKLRKVLQILAFEIGSPISYNDIAFKAGLENETVERYIDLFQKSFLLLEIPSFYNGHKYELKKTHTVYFLDSGIRNALIQNFNEPEIRYDLEDLWRNWLLAERIKWNALNGKKPNYFFWRTHTKQHIDFIEQKEDSIVAYKSIWDKRKKPKFPKSFSEAYAGASLHPLNRATYWGFLSGK